MRVRWVVGLCVVLELGGCARDRRGSQAPPDHAAEPSGATESRAIEPAPDPAHDDGDDDGADDGAEPEAVAGPTVDETLEGPSEAEFRAWDRRDPEAEARLLEWDRQHLPRMLGYFQELRCHRHAVLTAGERFLEGKSDEAQWAEARRSTILALDAWLKLLFTKEPEALGRSKLIGHFLEAHELVMSGYPRAYDERDDAEVERSHAHWAMVEGKIRKTVELVGGVLPPAPRGCAAS